MLLPGDWVEVLPASEIYQTLDENLAVDGLPFMPEMLPFCGRRFRVAMRAERTCIHPPVNPLRKLREAVVLQGLRCEGAAHGGCQLGCMLMWKERWLRRVDGPGDAVVAPDPGVALVPLRVTRRGDPSTYFCQGTELPRATTPGEPLWNPVQYLRFLAVRTFTPAELLEQLSRLGRRKLRKVIASALGAARGRKQDPEPFGLEAGQWVEVKPREEIDATLDARGMHRGLAFSGEMYAFCGRRMRVAKRVTRILDETTGRLRHVKDTVILDGSICDRYLGCARGMPHLWREAWLRPASAPAERPDVRRTAGGEG